VAAYTGAPEFRQSAEKALAVYSAGAGTAIDHVCASRYSKKSQIAVKSGSRPSMLVYIEAFALTD